MFQKALIINSILLAVLLSIYAQDTVFIKVHFLYGSKPKKEHKDTESNWFGGIHGGHVGIEFDSNKIIDFVPYGDFHITARRNDRNSRFVFHSIESFYELFSDSAELMNKAIFIIPIDSIQLRDLYGIVNQYMKETPYDYAFWGMRCASAAYDILAQIDILKEYSHRRTYRKIFYPKILRKKLFKKAIDLNWKVYLEPGNETRKWEKDKIKYIRLTQHMPYTLQKRKT